LENTWDSFSKPLRMTAADRSEPKSSLQLERTLLGLATAFLVVFAAALTLAPAARLRNWEAELNWAQWLGVFVWVVVFWSAQWTLARRHPEHDPFLLPAAGLLTGMGLLTIYRLIPGFGLRQSAWLALAGGVLLLGLRRPDDLSVLRRFKYVWLTAGLGLTAATLILGTSPEGVGPRLWLGWGGIYLQPSEPLKLLLIVYLAAYLADRVPAAGGGNNGAARPRLSLYTLGPTLILTGLALLLLIVQRDLGTASIFLFLYAAVVYIATADWRIPAFSLLALIASGIAGYALFDVVQLRIEAWVNPWLDPSGRSYQIVQSLLAVANGGLIGRGPGLGNPGLVPVSHSDFIFSAISEEFGLSGAVAILAALGLLLGRGLRAALRAPDVYRRLLAAGLTIHLSAQSIVIIGGTLRLLPLTGVTLPFVSYGGSSLLVAFIELLCLLQISAAAPEQPIASPGVVVYRRLAGAALLGLAAAGLVAGWWAFWRGPDLLTRSDNARRSIADRFVPRGAILARNSQPLAETQGQPGDLRRVYPYAPLGPIVGYTNPVYGQSGLEFSQDTYLRGLQGYPAFTIWQNQLLYGMPPEGLDVRLSLDLPLQQVADELLNGQTGALVLLNAQSGEILAMATAPTFDANILEAAWENLVQDDSAPLLNRAADGLYPPGSAVGPFLFAAAVGQSGLPSLPTTFTYSLDGSLLDCASQPGEESWGAAIANGCPGSTVLLAEALGPAAFVNTLDGLGLFTAPLIRLPAQSGPTPDTGVDMVHLLLSQEDAASGASLMVSPLQMALAAAALSNQGTRPAPLLVMAVDTPQSGWVMLPALSEPVEVFSPQTARATVEALADPSLPTWQTTGCLRYTASEGACWTLGGTREAWPGAPFALALLVEKFDPVLVTSLGRAMLEAAVTP
jgi:cell division protein FtsW (lipid II flippase)